MNLTKYITGFRACACTHWAVEDIVGGLDLYFSDDSVYNIGCRTYRNSSEPFPIVMLKEGEYIEKVHIYSSDNNGWHIVTVSAFTVFTNMGRVYGPYGYANGTKITSSGSKLLGLYGTHGMVTDSLGMIWEESCDNDTVVGTATDYNMAGLCKYNV